MKSLAGILGVACRVVCIAGSAFAAGTVVVVPEPSAYVDTEASTNVVFRAGDEKCGLFSLTLDICAATTNNVTVAFGRDGNGDGDLDRAETDLEIGWDAGAWFCRNRTTDAEQWVERTPGRRRLDLKMFLESRRTPKHLYARDADGLIFDFPSPSFTFDPSWNLVKVSTRGRVNSDGLVEAIMDPWGLMVFLR